MAQADTQANPPEATRDVNSEEDPLAASPLPEPSDDCGVDVPRQVIRKRVKILFITANSRGDQQLALGEEFRTITQAIRESKFRDAFDIVPEFAVRQKDLQRALLQHRPDIVHFACHGSKDGKLVLLREDGTSGPISASTLASYFRILRSNIALVVLNSCFSSKQAAAVCRMIGVTIGMRQTIGDEAALHFSEAFYQGLAYGCSVRQAFDLGAAAIGTSRSDDAGMAELLEREGVNTRAICFVGEQLPGQLPELPPPGSGWPVRLIPVAAGLGFVVWCWGMFTGSHWGFGAMTRNAGASDAPTLNEPTPLEAPSGMVLFTGARIRPGIFDLAKRPEECAAMEPKEDCALRQEPAKVPEVALEDFYLDRYEVTNRDFAAWLDSHRDAWRRNTIDPAVIETSAEPSVFLLRTGKQCGLEFIDHRIHPLTNGASQPATCMTWTAARDYCLAHPDQKRLPLDAEWEFAAKGIEGRAFPWGSQPPQPDRVAFHRGNSISEHAVAVGTSTQDVSPQGIYDLGGNVAEWVDQRSASDANKPIRGGSWNSTDSCHLLSSGCKHIKTESFSRDVGFRCAKTAMRGQGRR